MSPGEHTLMCAARGLAATGVDLAPTALRAAEDKARERGLAARFRRQDARELAGLGETFATVLDCGLFHVFGGDDRATYVASLHSVLRPGGRYFMLCFSDRQPGTMGPHRLTAAELRAAFAGGWRIDSLEPATIEITQDPAGVRAWLLAATRLRSGPMLSAEAEVGTAQPERYVTQFARHARQAHRLHRGPGGDGGDGGDGPSRPEVREVSVTGAACTVSFSTGRCTLAAAGQALRLRAEAASEQDLAVIQGLADRDIERLGQREGVQVRWRPA